MYIIMKNKYFVRYFFITILIAFFFAPPCKVWGQAERIDLLFNQAYQEKDPLKKIDLYQKVLELDPDNSDAYNNLGVAYKGLKMYEKATASYRKALQDPNYEHPEFVYNNMGLVYSLQKKYKKATMFFKKAISINPRFTKAYNNMGIAYKNMGDFDRGMAAFEKALEIDPNFFPAKMNLRKIWRLPDIKADDEAQLKKLLNSAKSHLKHGSLKEALAEFREVIKRDEGNLEAHEKIELIKRKQSYQRFYNKGFQQMQDGEWKRAYENFSNAIKYTDDPVEKENVSTLRKEVNFRLKKEEFLRDLQELYLRGLDSYKNEKWSDALSIYKKIFAMDPGFRDVKAKINECKLGYLFEKGKKELKSEKLLQAKESFIKVLKIFPNHIGAKEELDKIELVFKKKEVLALLAKANKLFEEKRYPASGDLYKQILRIDKNNKQALAAIHELQEIDQEKQLKSTFSKLTVNVFIVIIVIILYFLISKLPQIVKTRDYYKRYKDFDKARLMYEEIINKEPSRRPVYHPLARLYKELRQNEKIDTLVSLAKKTMLDAKGSELASWYACVGEILKERENFREAMVNLEKAYALLPEDKNIQTSLSSTYETILLQGKDEPEIRLKLAIIYKKQNKMDMAIAEFELVSHDSELGEKAKAFLEECTNASTGIVKT